MPHITKLSEKRLHVRMAVRALEIPEKFYGRVAELPQRYSEYTAENKHTLFNLIEDIIANTIKTNWTDGNFFNEFVEIKEVPYG